MGTPRASCAQAEERGNSSRNISTDWRTIVVHRLPRAFASPAPSMRTSRYRHTGRAASTLSSSMMWTSSYRSSARRDSRRDPIHNPWGQPGKSFVDIHREIRAFQTQPAKPAKGMPSAFRFMMSTPWPMPRLFIRLIRAVSPCYPTRPVTAAGTVGVTALGMAGRGGGWGLAPAGAIPPANHRRHRPQAGRRRRAR